MSDSEFEYSEDEFEFQDASDDDFVEGSPVASAKPKSKPKPKPKSKAKPQAKSQGKNGKEKTPAAGSGTSPLEDCDSRVNQLASGSGIGKSPKAKSSSQTYQKLTQLEHILKRPDTYIGSVEPDTVPMWVYDQESGAMVHKPVTIVPGLFKIFDEILVNAADNKIRDPNMKYLKVWIDAEKGLIEIFNDGKGIPIEMHEKEQMYIPELIFGNLLTSSNYDDNQKKVVGGRNGFGAKLCNIFSTEFTVETADKNTGKVYKQTWKNNMAQVGKPSITTPKVPKEYTKVSFRPDWKLFGMSGLDADLLGVMRRRVYDLAGTVRGADVYLDGKRIPCRNFKSYVELYVKALQAQQAAADAEAGEISSVDTTPPAVVHEVINDRWEIAFAVSDGSFHQVSFVNSIATTSGGTHVSYICDQLVGKIGEVLEKRHKSAKLKPSQIRNNIFLFVNCLIENPAFTSQTKEQMITRISSFGSKAEISADFMKKVLKTRLMDNLLQTAEKNSDRALKKSDGSKKNRITGLVKLEDANKAGTRESHKCTLILTEGDSAMSLAVAGLAVVGRDYYGVFPLRGKMLNVREASHEQISKNAEIQAIKQIIGLQHKKHYTDTKSLRYGHIMIMTDQDHDGSHIKGLIINFLETSFPGLLEIPGFLIEFITPIVKVTILGKRGKRDVLSFYNMPEYEEWRATEGKNCSWTQKYYKGLGTSTPQEGREYFSQLDKHLKLFHALQDNDKPFIDLAFSKKKADDRKEWLRNFVPGTHLDPELKEIPISDFINKELILFSMADNIRSLPNVLDGLKPGQRKVVYGVFKRNLQTDIKVALLAGYISEHTGYHHGEQSLVQTIVGLAQDFVGSNNIYLLNPKGSFGTRAQGGKDAAAARYIYAELNPIARKIFPAADDALLTYVQDDEQTVEPEWYVPVVPMVLVNGAEGIGTGWSSNIPSYNPLDLVENIRRLMRGEELIPLVPWYRGWTGTIEPAGRDKFRVAGTISEVEPNVLEITELPVKMWTTTMKEFLLQGLAGTEKTKPWIKDMTEQHGVGIRFVVTLSAEEMAKARAMGLLERFKLVSSISTGNMVAFDPTGRIKKYDSVEEILRDYYYVRLEFYQRRKDHLLRQLGNIIEKLGAQARFVQLIITKKLIVANRRRGDLVAELERLDFPRIGKDGVPRYEKMLSGPSADQAAEADLESESDSDEAEVLPADADTSGVLVVINDNKTMYTGYDYLLGMPIWSLTRERFLKLEKQLDDKNAELKELSRKSAKDLWEADLQSFEAAFEDFMAYDESKMLAMIPDKATGTRGKGKRKARAGDDDAEYQPKKSRKKAGPQVKAEPKSQAKAKTSRARTTSSTPEVKTEEPVEVPVESKKPAARVEKSASEVKREEPKLKSFFGKPSTIFGSPVKHSDKDVFDLEPDNLYDDLDKITRNFSDAASAFSSATRSPSKESSAAPSRGSPFSSSGSDKRTTSFVSRFGGDLISIDSDDESDMFSSKRLSGDFAAKSAELSDSKPAKSVKPVKPVKPAAKSTKPAAKTAAKPKRPVARSKKHVSDSESDSDAGLSLQDISEIVAQDPPPRARRQTAKKSYKIESDEDEYVGDPSSDEFSEEFSV